MNHFIKTSRNVETGSVRRNAFTPIPKLRPCVDAGIEEKYFACREKQNIFTETQLIKDMMHYLLRQMNDILPLRSSHCKTLFLHDIAGASVMYTNHDDISWTIYEPFPINVQIFFLGLICMCTWVPVFMTILRFVLIVFYGIFMILIIWK